MLEVLTTLCGVPCDAAKDENHSVLGVSTEWCMAFEHVRVSLELGKAQQWLAAFVEALGLDALQPELACKMANRLYWCLTASASRAGRSYLKALFAQANKPLPFEQCHFGFERHASGYASTCWRGRRLSTDRLMRRDER